MSTVNEIDNKAFPKLSKKKVEVNDLYIGGDKNMAGLDLMMYKDGIKDGREEGRVEGKVAVYVKLYKENMVSKEYAANELHISVDEFIKLAN